MHVVSSIHASGRAKNLKSYRLLMVTGLFFDGNTCGPGSICRELFAVGDELHQLPCHHEFHACCIQLWLQGSNTCPICRLQLPEADAEELEEQLEAKNSPVSLEEDR